MTVSNGSLPAPTLSDLERALDEVISALVAYRSTPPPAVERALAPKRNQPLQAIPIEQLMGTDQSVLRARDLADSPVEIGLKHSIKQLGKLIFEIVGDDRMLDVAERVAGLDDENWSRRMSPIDSAWSGIGSWVS